LIISAFRQACRTVCCCHAIGRFGMAVGSGAAAGSCSISSGGAGPIASGETRNGSQTRVSRMNFERRTPTTFHVYTTCELPPILPLVVSLNDEGSGTGSSFPARYLSEQNEGSVKRTSHARVGAAASSSDGGAGVAMMPRA
jgi:hypothetical protein